MLIILEQKGTQRGALMSQKMETTVEFLFNVQCGGMLWFKALSHFYVDQMVLSG